MCMRLLSHSVYHLFETRCTLCLCAAHALQAMLGAGDCRSSFLLVDGCLDLLATVALEVQCMWSDLLLAFPCILPAQAEAEEKTPGRLLSWLVQRLGSEAAGDRETGRSLSGFLILERNLQESCNSEQSREEARKKPRAPTEHCWYW